MKLDQIVQLHECIRIIYTVCPQYTAYLYIREETECILTATGETPAEALENLDKKADAEITERWWKK